MLALKSWTYGLALIQNISVCPHEVRNVPKKLEGHYREWFGLDGTYYRIKADAQAAGWEEA